ncbi:hypothetical protein ILUMI_00387 [Ignelater luminosus]|uniref:PiggyBac transposable element-derived protein domain-containing protein n=1 Tax=Ignelater luminosus TaxID=2038154 RepID=A0A8K0DLQ5_IGNLU|nr:hypothetical protein ILUMI_00387 [Ignelater luminosus]
MVWYYGRRSTKQHIQGKPIRFNYKLWPATTRNGYLISCEPYQRVKSAQSPYQEYGLGTAVVLLMKSCLPVQLAPYNFYFHNLFNSLTLVNIVDEHGNGATGTIRNNRLAKCSVTEAKLLKTGARGAFSFTTDTNLLIVTFATNCHNITPMQKVDRVASVNNKRTNLSKLFIVLSDVQSGIDRFDKNLNSMRVELRGKKWRFALFAFGLEATCHNAIIKTI